MSLPAEAEQVWIYLGEQDKIGLQQTATVLLDYLREQRVAGVTVLRGVAGYGPQSLARTNENQAMSRDLPMVVTFVDSPLRVAQVMPRVRSLVQHGLITRQVVEVVKYTRALAGSFPTNLTVADLMTRDVVTIAPEATVDMIVSLLVDRALRSVPVVDGDGRLVGIITDGDLLQRGGVLLPIPGLDGNSASATAASSRQHARDLMTPQPIWVPANGSLSEAAALLVAHDLKRLPVLDEQGRLVGMISRGDLLGSVAGQAPAPESRPARQAGQVSHVAEVMLREVPTVAPTSTLPEVLEALLQARQRRIVVVDNDRRVLGLITDGDVMQRAARHVPAVSASGIRGWLRGGQRPATVELVSSQVRARDIMTSPVQTIPANTPIREAVEQLLALKVNRLPVVDENGRLVGLVGRAGLLQALTQEAQPANGDL